MLIFSYIELEKFFKHIKENYTVTSLTKWNGSNAIILRHDVDFDIKPAYNLALKEKEFDINSTFFIMTSSLTYNPLSFDNRRMLKKMSKMGFEIGLHFDPSIYGTKNYETLSTK